MKILCWLRTIWDTLKRPAFWSDGVYIDGHEWVDIEVHENRKVTISKCEECGEEIINWE